MPSMPRAWGLIPGRKRKRREGKRREKGEGEKRGEERTKH